MRTVLDTNILIAALITKDTPPDTLYQAWLRGKIEVVTSPAQISEIAAVLYRPHLLKFIHPDEASILLENLDTRAIIFNDPDPVDFSPDPADNRILAVAIAAEADLIVSGDKKHMLFLNNAAGIPIVSARQAVDRLSRGGILGINSG
ncbi:MAG: putative toxin-antitoxin system toxin component, PIN family, partial [Desulfobacterales bacterium]|nr:putative toxin-antitoxin system toxin component, PIN family [Desulfobacterales bacterium]